MDKKYISATLSRVLVALVALVLIATLIYHSTDMGTTTLSTVIAEETDFESIISGKGYFFRQETVLQVNGGKGYSTLTAGENVSFGSKVASVYPASADIEALKSYDKLIALLTEGSNKKDLSLITAELKKLSAELRQSSMNGTLSGVLAEMDALNILLNQASAASGGSVDLKAELDRLKGERSALLASFGAALTGVYAPTAGCYYPDCDGYEALFSADRLDTLTVSAFEALTASAPEQLENAGKLVTDSYWYMATVVDSNDLLNTAIGREYTVYVGSGMEKYRFTLDRVAPDGVGKSLLVFGCRITPKTLPARAEQISIVTETATGLTVPTAAVRVLTSEDGIDTVGVYVREGNYLRFKRIEILSEQKGSYLVKTPAQVEKETPKPAEGEEASEPLYPYLELNDVVVTSGKNLKEGYFR